MGVNLTDYTSHLIQEVLDPSGDGGDGAFQIRLIAILALAANNFSG